MGAGDFGRAIFPPSQPSIGAVRDERGYRGTFAEVGMITVAELIRLLSQFDGGLPVVTPGFDESGIDDIAPPRLVSVKFDVAPRGGHGAPHEEMWQEKDRARGTPAVLINFQ